MISILMIFLFTGLIIPVLADTIDPPLKQYDPKIDPHNIECKPDLKLVFKDKVWTPACVKPSSVEKLIERGWAAKHDPHHMEIMTPMEKDDLLSIHASKLKQKMTADPNLIVIDMRDSTSYMDGHIKDSTVDVMEGSTLEKRIKTMHSKIPEVVANTHFVLVDDSEDKALDSAKIMNEKGIKTSYLVGGIQSWIDELSTKATPTLTYSDIVYQQIQNQEDIYLLDVREPSELEVTMISGSKNIPLADIFIEENLSEIPTDKPVIVICGSGNRATIATYELAQHDIDFQVLDGGIKAWNTYLEENNLPKQ